MRKGNCLPLSQKNSAAGKKSKSPLNPQMSIDMLESNPYEMGFTYQDIINYRRNYSIYNKVTVIDIYQKYAVF